MRNKRKDELIVKRANNLGNLVRNEWELSSYVEYYSYLCKYTKVSRIDTSFVRRGPLERRSVRRIVPCIYRFMRGLEDIVHFKKVYANYNNAYEHLPRNRQPSFPVRRDG